MPTTYWQTTPNWKKSPFPQPADFKPLPSRDALGPRHVISRLLGQFETFGAISASTGASRDFGRHDLRQIAQIPIYVYETTKARQRSLTGLV